MKKTATFQEQFINIHDVRYFIKKAGKETAPLVLFLHGFPDSWYSWRHQLSVVAAAGYHAVAPDMLGYGQTDAPEAVGRYDQGLIAQDMVGLITALGYEQAIVVGHDFGAAIAWQMCLLYPEKVKAVVGLCMAYGGRAVERPTDYMKKAFAGRFFYMLYFQEPGLAEAELDEDKSTSILKIYYSLSAEGGEAYVKNLFPLLTEKTKKYLDTMQLPDKLPDWLSKTDVEYYVSRFSIHGFRPAVNYYRCLDAYWERTEHLTDKKITQPAYFLVGKNDPITLMGQKAIHRMPDNFTHLQGIEYLDNCGHWIACEQPEVLNQKLINFITQQ